MSKACASVKNTCAARRQPGLRRLFSSKRYYRLAVVLHVVKGRAPNFRAPNKVTSMNTSANPQAGRDGHYLSTDPELGMYDIRIFWLAALAAIVAVLAVAYFKMGY